MCSNGVRNQRAEEGRLLIKVIVIHVNFVFIFFTLISQGLENLEVEDAAHASFKLGRKKAEFILVILRSIVVSSSCLEYSLALITKPATHFNIAAIAGNKT